MAENDFLAEVIFNGTDDETFSKNYFWNKHLRPNRCLLLRWFLISTQLLSSCKIYCTRKKKSFYGSDVNLFL